MQRRFLSQKTLCTMENISMSINFPSVSRLTHLYIIDVSFYCPYSTSCREKFSIGPQMFSKFFLSRLPPSNYPAQTTKQCLANVNSSSCSLYVVVRPSVVCLSVVCLSSVCLSVTFVRPTQTIEIFGNVSTL